MWKRDDMLVPQIVLATYNGDRYIERQLESILSNALNLQVLIHDDGSNDATLTVIESLKRCFNSIIIIPGVPTGGAKQNFGYLLKKTTSPYVFCSDQDDVWHPDKLSIFMEAMLQAEQQYGSSTPLLVHSDLRVIDDSGKVIMDSFWKYQHLDPKWGDDMRHLLTQNVVTGCAMMVNRALLNKALPLPESAVMHDWWLALVACAFGQILALPVQTVDYRQHTSNEVGAKKFDLNYIGKRALGTISKDETSMGWRKAALQASAFAERFPGVQGSAAEQFATLLDQSYFRRLRTKCTKGFWKIGLARNIGWLFLC